MGTKEEINEMFDALERTVEVETPATEAPVIEEQVEKPEEKAPATEPPKEEKEEAPATSPPKEDDELARIKAENEELRRKVADQVTLPKPKEEPKPPATEPPIADQDFVKDIDLDEVTREPSTFNKLLNTIYKKAVETVRGEVKKTREEVIQTVPEMVQKNLEVKQSLKELSQKFYNENKDLKPFAKVVGVVFEELASQNPGRKYNEVLEMVGEETRNRLGLKKSESGSEPVGKDKNDNKDDDPPPLPRKKGGRVTQPRQDSNPLASEIDQMNKVLGR
jgi:hypothetical protein